MKVGNYCGQRRPAWGGRYYGCWGRPPCPSAASRGTRKFVCSPQTATKPPRKPHNPRMAAGVTATRGRAKSRVLRVLCAFCASYGALAAGGGEVEEAAHEKFARSPCHHTAASAPIAPASVRGAMGVFFALANILQLVSLSSVRRATDRLFDYLTAGLPPKGGLAPVKYLVKSFVGARRGYLSANRSD